MIDRRRLVLGCGASLLFGRATFGGSETAALPSGDAPADDLIALPGKKPLIKRTSRPPNFETPLADLRSPYTANDAFFVRYHLANIPEVDPVAWRLRVDGASAGRKLDLSLDDLRRRFEQVSVVAINQCSGNRRGLFMPRAAGVQWGYGAMGNATWTGVRLRDVLNRAGVRGDALEVVFDGADSAVLPGTPDFVKSLPVDKALHEDTLIAFEMNGQPLPHWHGAPARLVVPGWTATYWMKHLVEIRVEPARFDGFWMKTGYRVPTGKFPGASFRSQETAETTPITEILVNSLLTSHENGTRIPLAKATNIMGWAWDGGSGIDLVEISADDGRSWQRASLGSDLGRYAWRQFSWKLQPSAAGVLRVAVRARSRGGAVQPVALTPNPAGYHHNVIQTLQLEVA